MTHKDPNIIVTPQLEECGAMSYWRLSGDVDFATLHRAWIDAGLDPKALPKEPGPETALRRAVASLAEKRMLVRPLKRRGAWAIVAESVAGTTDLNWDVVCRVFWDNAISIEHTTHPRSYEIAGKVRNAYSTHAGMLSTTDVSSFLVHCAGKLQATSLRDSGGVYFIPRPTLNLWRKMVAVIADDKISKHAIFNIPALRNDEAVAAILDAITHEADAEIHTLEGMLEARAEEAVGPRALKSKAAHCRKVLDKVASYEKLLNIKLDGIKEKLERLDVDLTAAALSTLNAA